MRYRLIIPLCFVTSLFIFGCFANKSLRLSDQELFKLGQTQYNKNKYIKARETLTLLIDYYPDSVFTGEAQMLKADSFFKEKNYIEAGVEYGLFLEFHPAHPKADYALFQEAECNYKHVGSIDRDQTNTLETMKKLKKLVALYPDSPFVPKAKERIAECQELIQSHSLYVARFYNRWGVYSSSINRYKLLLNSKPPITDTFRSTLVAELKEVKLKYHDILITRSHKNFEKGKFAHAANGYELLLKHFPDTEKDEFILFRMATSYLQMKKYDKAKDFYQKILDTNPEGQHSQQSHEKLEEIDRISSETVS